MTLVDRNGTFHLRKRVPKRYASVEERSEIWISLGTDSEEEARIKAGPAWQRCLDALDAKLAGNTDDAEAQFEAARSLAQARGFRYLPIGDVTKLPLAEMLQRIEAIKKTPSGKPDQREARALLGTVERPRLKMSQALDVFWDLARDRTIGKSPDQMRRWRNPRKKAFRNFIKVVGDVYIDELTQDDMLDFTDWWVERVETEGLAPNSANRDITNICNTLKTINKKKRLGLNLPISDLRLKEGEAKTRPPFSTEWIKTKILAPGALNGMNVQARCIVLGMVNTGYRPSEGASLTAKNIRLDTEIPHINIDPEGRTLKSQYSKRVIPLAGVSLDAFRECPEGFPRYADNPGLSDTVNKYFRHHGLNETPEHVVYSLRHSFEDRMLAAEVDERIRRDIFGHRLNRERYGKGASLEHKARIIEGIAL